MKRKINWGMKLIEPKVSDLSRLRRRNRAARIEAGQRPATITTTRTVGNKVQFLHPTKGWR